MRDRATAVGGAVLAALMLASCAEGEKHSRGLDYMPDMYDSPAYRSYQSEVVVVKAGDKDVVHHVPMLLTPPEGAVSRDFVAYAIAPTDFTAARANPNPVVATAAVLKTGQANFNIYCAVCHGNDGNAVNGYVAKQFSGIPSLATPNVAAMPDGEVYHIATVGRGRMPNYRAQLLPETRWAVVHYVKALARSSMTVEAADQALAAAEADAAKTPNDETKVALAKAKIVAENAKKDHALILQGGTGDDFTPKPAAVPEYVKPEWPEH